MFDEPKCVAAPTMRAKRPKGWPIIRLLYRYRDAVGGITVEAAAGAAFRSAQPDEVELQLPVSRSQSPDRDRLPVHNGRTARLRGEPASGLADSHPWQETGERVTRPSDWKLKTGN